jgi:hypothetical protein
MRSRKTEEAAPMNEKEQIEQEISQSLTEGEMAERDPHAYAPERLRTRYEIRTQAETDPIVEETRIVRSMAKEVDDRYDEYMQRAEKGTDDKGEC